MKKEKKRVPKALKIFVKILGSLLILSLLLILFIRSPWGQNIIVNKVTSYISDRTGTEVAIEKMFITFSGAILLDGLYLEDKKGDTLIYSDRLEAKVPLWPIIKGNAIAIDDVEWSGVRARILRKDAVEGFNYQFLIDALAPTDTARTKPADTSAIDLNLGDFDLSDIQLYFDDQVSGMRAQLDLGELELSIGEIDLEKRRFLIDDARLAKTEIQYRQSKPLPESEPTTTAPPLLGIDGLEINDVQISYESIPDDLVADAQLSKFLLEAPLINLSNNEFEVGNIHLKNSTISLETSKRKATDSTKTTSVTNNNTFKWPEYDLTVEKIDFSGNQFNYSVNGAIPKKNKLDPNAIRLKDFALQVNNVNYRPKKAFLNVNNISFSEASGIDLNQLGFQFDADDTGMALNEIKLTLNENQLLGNGNIKYASLGQLFDNPDKAKVSLNLQKIYADLATAFRFQPELEKNEYLKTLSQRPIEGNLRAKGTLADIAVQHLELNWGSTTDIMANGKLLNATKPEKLRYNFPNLQVQTVKEDLQKLVGSDSLGVNPPEQITLITAVSGSTQNLNAKGNLDSSQGNILFEMESDFGEAITFNGNVQTKKLAIGKLLQNPSLGQLNMQIEASGSGSSVNTLDADLKATVGRFSYNGYAIKNLDLTGSFNNGQGTLASAYKDNNINLDFDAGIVLDSVAPSATVNLHLKGMDLQAFGITQKNVRTALKMSANFKGNADAFDLSSEITEAVAVYDDQSYLIGDFDVAAFVRPDTTSVDIANRMLGLHLESNANPRAFTKAIRRHFERYLTDSLKVDSVVNPVKLKLRGNINEAPVLEDVLISNLNRLDTVNLEVDFDEKARSLSAVINAPLIDYGGNTLENLDFVLDSDADSLGFTFGVDALTAGPIAIKRTDLIGSVSDKRLFLDFNSHDGEKRLLHIGTIVTEPSESIVISIDPNELILNGNPWSIPANNEIVLNDTLTEFDNFILTRNDQRLAISNTMPNVAEQHIGMDFENFKLASFLRFLNPERDLANGRLNGKFIMEHPNEGVGLLADLNIDDFKILGVDMGKLTLDANSENSIDYDLRMVLKDGNADLDIKGGFAIFDDTTMLDLNLALNSIDMKTLEAFSFGELKESKGRFTGNISINGPTQELKYNGRITFDDAGFRVTKLNASFVLAQETLRLDNQGIYFDEFSLQDERQNRFVVNGTVGTENLLNPSFDIGLQAKNFQVLNSTEDDFDLFYGTANFDVDAKLMGDLNLPKLDVELKVGEATDVTYVVPASEVQVESRRGVVVFVNKENPDAILTETEETTFTQTGITVDARLRVDPQAVFHIILDEQAGDNFQVQGNADLDFNLYPNGRMTLTGAYEVEDGHYEAGLYNLVKRRFGIVKGSRVTWSGDPFDADLDIRAQYDVEASAAALMSATTSGADISTRQRFRQEFDFLVYLNIGGQPLQPEISFNLDMAEDQQGAIGGQVYGRLQQINQQENELNKQVFSLLVLNKFYPDPGSDGSTGGTTGFARDNINDAISDQLNVISEKVLGDSGVELDFGLDSYTDYQGDSPQNRTTLDVAAQKKLFDERLIFRVGSEVDLQGRAASSEGSAPVIGNVSLEYLITEEGRYRLKGFRRNEFENAIDGQLIVSGIALIFTREFNKFTELWQSMFSKEAKENRKNKAPDEK